VVRALQTAFTDSVIRCFVRTSSSRANLPESVQFAVGDLRDSRSLRQALAGADTLVSLASLGFDWNDPVFEALRGSTVTRGVFLSTTAILTKLPVKSKPVREHGEALVRNSGIDWTILRPTMIYGTPADRNISRLIRLVRRSPIVPVVAPHARQQPVYVTDVADAVVAVLASERTSRQTYNISGRDPICLEEVIRTVAEVMGLNRRIVTVPLGLARSVVAFHERLARKPVIRVEQIDRLAEDKAFDHNAALRDFGFAPLGFRDGVHREIAMMSFDREPIR